MVPLYPRETMCFHWSLREKREKKQKEKEKKKCFIDFCLCTADVKDRQKEGRTSGLNLS